MASSGTFTFRTDRDEIIKGALRLVGGYDPENSSGLTATQITDAAEALNLLIKSWEAIGLHLWERKYAVIFPNTHNTYVLGGPGPGGDHATLSNPLGASYLVTTLSAAASSGATTVTVTDTSADVVHATQTAFSITNGYNIGIEQDDGTMHWTTVSGAPSGSTVTLSAALTNGASEDNRVFVYQNKCIKPLRILDAFVRNWTGNNDLPCRILTKDEYNRFGLKTTRSVPTQVYYDPRVNSGHVYIYPGFGNMDMGLILEVASPIEDFSASTDDYDMPQVWGAALKFNLALHLGLEYEVPEDKWRMIERMADKTFQMVKDFDQESPGSVFFSPDYMGR